VVVSLPNWPNFMACTYGWPLTTEPKKGRPSSKWAKNFLQLSEKSGWKPQFQPFVASQRNIFAQLVKLDPKKKSPRVSKQFLVDQPQPFVFDYTLWRLFGVDLKNLRTWTLGFQVAKNIKILNQQENTDINDWLVVSTHPKNTSQIKESSPSRDEHKKCLKPPPR